MIFGVHNPMASWFDSTIFFREFGSLFFPGNVNNSTSFMYVYFPRLHPSYLHWWTQHQSLESLGLSIVTVNDVLFIFTSGVATPTGSNDACSLRQITWSINEKTGVSAGMEMTRKYRIEVVWDWSLLHKIRFGLA